MPDLRGYGPSIFEGAWLTLEVALLSLVLSAVIGMLGATAKLSHVRGLRWAATAYTTIIRGVPDLVLMLLIFFGGQVLANHVADALGFEEGIDIDPFVAGVATIALIFGAYMTETFRGAILAVPKGQLEAGYAYGLSRWRVYHRILVPQMMRHALPGLGNNWLVLLKATALVSVIGLEDMVSKGKAAGDATRMPFTFTLAVAFGFLAFTTVSVLLLRWAEKHYSSGFERRT